jgi:hypothetical protein
MELIPYFFSMLAFGFICFCFGVYKGSQATVKRFIEEFEK